METVGAIVEDVEWIRVEESSAPGQVRRAAGALAAKLGFSEHRVGEIAIAVTELATNLHLHATNGSVLLRVRRTGGVSAIEIIVMDAGPGLANLQASSRDGESTGGTLGIGLGAAMRMATRFDSHSVVGRGTVMIATFWSDAAPEEKPAVAGLTRPINGEQVCGDASAFRTGGGTTTILHVDGLGHGGLACSAAQCAVRAFLSGDEDDTGPARTIARLNGAMRGTRGAAVAVVRLDAKAASLTFAGVGNIAVWIDDGEKRRSLISQPGIVGNHTRVTREIDVPFPEHALVVLHSDGLTSKWDLNAYPGLRTRDLHLVAATLIRDAGVHRDDASVTVARAS
jgi:anti-sigma regulatory factor (Ser/Thr protein kinase)